MHTHIQDVRCTRCKLNKFFFYLTLRNDSVIHAISTLWVFNENVRSSIIIFDL